MPGDAVGAVAVTTQSDRGEGLAELARVNVVEPPPQPPEQGVWGILDRQVVKTDQPRHVDDAVVHVAAFGPPRHARQQVDEQSVGLREPAGADLDERAVAELPALGVLEQGALYRDPHGAQSIAHSFDDGGTGLANGYVRTVGVVELGTNSEVGTLRVVILHR